MKNKVFLFGKGKRKIRRSILPILGVDSENRFTGTYGEDLAAAFLQKRGYRIKERNFVAAGAEIDIIAENRDTVVFTEVKTRHYLPENRPAAVKETRPAASVTPEKQKKIFAASRFYSVPEGKHLRFDIVEVYLGKTKKDTEICHLKNAFTLDTAYRK